MAAAAMTTDELLARLREIESYDMLEHRLLTEHELILQVLSEQIGSKARAQALRQLLAWKAQQLH
jgi:hypothetical protein